MITAEALDELRAEAEAARERYRHMKMRGQKPDFGRITAAEARALRKLEAGLRSAAEAFGELGSASLARLEFDRQGGFAEIDAPNFDTLRRLVWRAADAAHRVAGMASPKAPDFARNTLIRDLADAYERHTGLRATVHATDDGRTAAGPFLVFVQQETEEFEELKDLKGNGLRTAIKRALSA
jgi:hypothetical protein